MLGFLIASLLAAAPQAPPAPRSWVTDPQGILSVQVRARLDRQLAVYERTSGHQVLVWVGASTGPEPIEDFAERAFAAWRVGRAGLDDGVVLFVFTDDRKLRIEVGYGLEGSLPDAVASRIVREQIAPALASGDPDAAISQGVDGILAAISADATSPPTTGPPPGPVWTPARIIVMSLLAFGFLVLLVVRPDLALHLLSLLLLFRHNGRHGPGGGGGFSGRGGRSGGGGASGGW